MCKFCEVGAAPKVLVKIGLFALAMAPKVFGKFLMIGRGSGCIWVLAYISQVTPHP